MNGSWDPLLSYLPHVGVAHGIDVVGVARIPVYRGAEALEAAGLRRGRPAVVDNFHPAYLDEEKEREEREKRHQNSVSGEATAQANDRGSGAIGGHGDEPVSSASAARNGSSHNGASGVDVKPGNAGVGVGQEVRRFEL